MLKLLWLQWFNNNLHILRVMALMYLSSLRPKDNEKVREELENAIHIIWNCNLPSPRVGLSYLLTLDYSSLYL